MFAEVVNQVGSSFIFCIFGYHSATQVEFPPVGHYIECRYKRSCAVAALL